VVVTTKSHLDRSVVVDDTTIIVKNGSGKPEPGSLKVAELALDTRDGALYSKLNDGSVVQLNDGAGNDGTGSSVHIGDTPPDDPQEGQQWLENTTGKVWIWDGSAWFQFPQGKDGAAGKDGNIADGASDGSQDGVIATWDDTAKQWTPEGNLSFDAGGRMYLGNEKINSHFYSNGAIISQRDVGNHFQAEFSDGTEGYFGRHLIGAYNSGTGEYTVRIGTNGDATFSGTVDAAGFTVKTTGYSKILADGTSSSSEHQYVVNNHSAFRIIDTTTGSFMLQKGPSAVDDVVFRIQPTGNAKFSGTVDAAGFTVNGSPLTRVSDLIETLSTLRASTLDEAVDVRQALASACDKLIEKFTEMEKTATQEVEDDS
jgi:hypothetical protein